MSLFNRIKNLWDISKFHPETVGLDDFKADLISDGFIGTKNSDGSRGVRKVVKEFRPATIVEDEPLVTFEEENI